MTRFPILLAMAALVTGCATVPTPLRGEFAPLAPQVAQLSGIPAVLLLMPMNFVSNLARSLSPISAVMIVVSGAAGLSPIELAKRTFLPVVLATIVNIAISLILFY